MADSPDPTPSRTATRFEWLDRLDEVIALEPRWRELEEQVRDRMVFGSFDHVLPWYRHHAERYGTPMVGTAWRGDSCVGILPLALRRTTLGPVPLRRVECMGHDGETGEYLFADGGGRLLEGFLDSLLRRGVADVIELLGIAADSEHLRAIDSVASRRRLRVERRPYRYAIIDLAHGFDAYQAGLGSKLRGNLRRRARRAEEMGGAAVDRIHARADSQTLARALERLYGIADRSWKAAENGDAIRGHYRDFYRELAERFHERGLLDLSFLTVGGKDAAFVFGIRERGVFYDVTVSYDEAFSGISPGTLLIQEVARRAGAEGVRLLVSHGDREYKRHWASGWVDQERVTLFAPGVRGSFGHLTRFRAPAMLRRLHGRPPARGAD